MHMQTKTRQINADPNLGSKPLTMEVYNRQVEARSIRTLAWIIFFQVKLARSTKISGHSKFLGVGS